jgi:hypothetical protein
LFWFGIFFKIISFNGKIVNYFKADIYWYRLELVVELSLAFVLILTGLIRVILGDLLPKQMDTIIFSIMFYMMEATNVLFPLGLTIIWELKRLRNKGKVNQDNDIAIEQIINRKETTALLIKVAQREWSLENILIWVKCGNGKLIELGGDTEV